MLFRSGGFATRRSSRCSRSTPRSPVFRPPSCGLSRSPAHSAETPAAVKSGATTAHRFVLVFLHDTVDYAKTARRHSARTQSHTSNSLFCANNSSRLCVSALGLSLLQSANFHSCAKRSAGRSPARLRYCWHRISGCRWPRRGQRPCLAPLF